MKNKQPLCFGVRLGRTMSLLHGGMRRQADEIDVAGIEETHAGQVLLLNKKRYSAIEGLTKTGAARFSDGKFIEVLRKMQEVNTLSGARRRLRLMCPLASSGNRCAGGWRAAPRRWEP